MTALDRKCGHNCFDYCIAGATPFVFVFSRPRYTKPTEAQLADYHRRMAIVEENGGHMDKMEYEFAGENPKFSKQDIESMIDYVFRDNPDLTLDHHWNGVGYYTFRVGAKLR